MNDSVQIFRLPKKTGTHADVFAAVGLADLLSALPDSGTARIVEQWTEFEVCLSRSFTKTDLEHTPQTPGYPFLKTNEKVMVPKDVSDFVDYKAEKAKA